MPSAMTFDERYRAISTRDPRFDGQFVMAVRTTGIYCRPSCPARTPNRANVEFYPTSAAAHQAGFRACRRCLPEAAPGSPEWNIRGDLAARAMRLIADGVVDREGVTGLSTRLGYTSRHLNRLLAAELGAGPLALARAQRAHTARMLLVGTGLPVSDVAHSAGFTSIRQCNDTIREVFGMTPTQLRAHRRSGATAAASGAPGEIDLLLPHREPIDLPGLFDWMAARALPRVESGGPASFSRHIRMPHGSAWFEIRRTEGRLRLRARVAGLSDLTPLVAAARRLFDLDADPIGIDTALAARPELAPAVAATPGIRVPGSADPHEMLIRAMVGQQVSVASARTALTALARALGEPVADSAGPGEGPGEGSGKGPGDGLLFPTMAAIAEHGAEVLRGPAARIQAITSAAQALADGQLRVSVGEDAQELRRSLLERPGIGPWTADYVRMRVLNDPDALLPGDVAARAGARALGLPDDPRGLADWAAESAPWRSYLTAHLWRSAPARPRTTPRKASA